MLIIKNAELYTMTGSIIDNGDILIHEGKIREVGKNLSCKGAAQIDATGLTAIPGIVDAHSHIGGFKEYYERTEDDINEMTDNATPHMQAIYGVDADVRDFKCAYENGITTVAITPGSGNVVGGWVFAAKTFGSNIFEMTIRNPVALKVALGGNPRRYYGEQKKAPMTRMGIAGILTELLSQARDYMEKKERAIREKLPFPEYQAKYEAVIPVLRREIPLKIHCTQYDIATAIEIAGRFNVKFSLDHAWGAEYYYDAIEKSGCSIIFGPMGYMRSHGECYPISIASVAELDRRGVTTALATDSSLLSVDCILHMAGEAVREGCEVERVLKMITINPARILGVEDRIGSIEAGKDADIVLFNGLPAWDTHAKAVCTIINGQVVYKNKDVVINIQE